MDFGGGGRFHRHNKKDDDFVRDFGEKPEGRGLFLPVVTDPEIVKVGNKGGTGRRDGVTERARKRSLRLRVELQQQQQQHNTSICDV